MPCLPLMSSPLEKLQLPNDHQLELECIRSQCLALTNVSSLSVGFGNASYSERLSSRQTDWPSTECYSSNCLSVCLFSLSQPTSAPTPTQSLFAPGTLVHIHVAEACLSHQLRIDELKIRHRSPQDLLFMIAGV